MSNPMDLICEVLGVVKKNTKVSRLKKLVVEEDLPPEVVETANKMLSRINGDPMRCGDTKVMGNYFIETHTLGCRREADDPEDTWWDEHWAFYDKYNSDDVSVVFGDPEDGIFATVTPLRPLAESLREKSREGATS